MCVRLEMEEVNQMTRTIGIGVIGMGWMGEAHSRAYRLIADRFHDSGIQPRLVVCADSVEPRQAAQERFGYERYTTDWRDVMADPEVEAVDITAPNGMHLEVIKAAAAAGKHISCEKPVGREPQETIDGVAAARAAGVITSVGYNYRWAPVVQYARQLIADGKLGQHHPLSRPLPQRLCRRPQRLSLLALRAGVRPGHAGRPDVARDRHGAHAGRPHHARDQRQGDLYPPAPDPAARRRHAL